MVVLCRRCRGASGRREAWASLAGPEYKRTGCSPGAGSVQELRLRGELSNLPHPIGCRARRHIFTAVTDTALYVDCTRTCCSSCDDTAVHRVVALELKTGVNGRPLHHRPFWNLAQQAPRTPRALPAPHRAPTNHTDWRISSCARPSHLAYRLCHVTCLRIRLSGGALEAWATRNAR